MIDRIFQCATEGDLSQDHLLIYRGGAFLKSLFVSEQLFTVFRGRKI